MTEEQLRILRMVEEGRATPEQGARLIEALRHRQQPPSLEPPSPPAERLTVRVFRGKAPEPAAELVLPFRLGKRLLELLRGHAGDFLEEHGVSPDQIADLLDALREAGPREAATIHQGETRVEVGLE